MELGRIPKTSIYSTLLTAFTADALRRAFLNFPGRSMGLFGLDSSFQ